MHSWKLLPVLLVGIGSGMAFAQQGESLLIGRGDLLHVQILDTPEMEQHVRVTDSGKITLLAGGDVEVAHHTPGEAAKLIEQALISGQIMKEPRVAVTVDEYATQRVTVVGEVRLPGVYPTQTSRSVPEVLGLSGGLTDVADRRIVIERNGDPSDTVSYFYSNHPGPSADSAVRVNPGDTLFVPKAGIVYALGDFHTPGGYTMTNNDGQLTVLQLVARANSFTNTAYRSHTRLLRKTPQGYSDTQINLADMAKGKIPDITLQPDDIVYVPFSLGKNILVTSTGGIAATLGQAAVYRF